VTIDKLLIPVKKYTRFPGSFSWPKASVLAGSAPVDSLPLQQLASDVAKRCFAKSRVVFNAFGAAEVRIRRHKQLGPEAYQINISKNTIEIFAGNNSGAYYAVQTLRDLLALEDGRLQCCIIEDWPDFGRRGVYHDCSRGKVPTLKTLKELVERLAHWKINELQLYIENVFSFKRHPAIGRGYSPFTAEEILALQACGFSCKFRPYGKNSYAAGV
jgi:hypothetical protein